MQPEVLLVRERRGFEPAISGCWNRDPVSLSEVGGPVKRVARIFDRPANKRAAVHR